MKPLKFSLKIFAPFSQRLAIVDYLLRQLILIFSSFWLICSLSAQSSLAWKQLSPLPVATNQTVQLGLAGPFVGVHNDVLMIAGGANFPDAPPWEGGQKVWWEDGFVLEKDSEGIYQWSDVQFQLPQALAYGVSISTEKGIICVGGNDANSPHASVIRLAWNSEKRAIEISQLPSLPEARAMMGGAQIGSSIFVCGGIDEHGKASNQLYRLNLENLSAGWQSMTPLPSSPRILPVMTAQADEHRTKLYFFSGRNHISEQEVDYLYDAWSYDPVSNSWTELQDIQIGKNPPRCLMAGTALPSGTNHILVFGGDQGPLYESHRQSQHPGFGPDILSYHTLTDTWIILDSLPGPMPVTTTAVQWETQIILPTGEIRPGVRSPEIWAGTLTANRSFGWFNYLVLALYLTVLVGMGLYFRRRTVSTEDFFMAGGRIPAWAAGLSIFGTQLSAITFMAIPAKTFATDWRYLTLNLTVILVAPIVILFFLPFFRRLNIRTAYHYLELRFNLATRLLGSSMFIALQIGRIGIVLFLPALALALVTGMDVRLCILLMGGLSILYTTLGGIEAVIWTDVLQVVVLLCGALGCLVVVPFWLEGDWGDWMSQIDSAQKLLMWDFRFDLTTPSFWVVLLGGIAANLISYGSDQTVIQRYLTTKDEQEARKSIWLGCIMAIPATFLFFSMGTALFLFYQQHPASLDPGIDNGDAIFPWFIVQELPPGIAGILIAAIFAASMSSLDSSMNSVATVGVSDFLQRLRGVREETAELRTAQWITVIVGVAGTGLALMMAGWGIKSFWDQLNAFIGLFTGGLGGLFILGIFSNRANGTGALVGLVCSGIIQFFVKNYTDLHLLMYTFTGIMSCLLIGYTASLFTKGQTPSKKPLSYTNLKDS